MWGRYLTLQDRGGRGLYNMGRYLIIVGTLSLLRPLTASSFFVNSLIRTTHTIALSSRIIYSRLIAKSRRSMQHVRQERGRARQNVYTIN